MRVLRLNLRTLLAVVLFLGIGFAAFREATDFWDSAVLSLTLSALLVSLLLALHHTEEKRAFWTGFVLFGWAYFALSMTPTVEPRLPTTRALAYLDSKVVRPALGAFAYFDYDSDGRFDAVFTDINQLHSDVSSGATPVLLNATQASGYPSVEPASVLLMGSASGTSLSFVRIGHSLLALIAAWLGANVSRSIYRRIRSPA
jgi:hypothetical protein